MSPYSLCRLTLPNALAISTQEAKEYLKIDHSEEDELLEKFIKAAVLKFENYTGRALICQSWQVTFRQFMNRYLILPVTPSVKINKIKLISFQNCVHEYDVKNCVHDPNINEIYFKEISFAYLLRIEYLAGYGYASENVPEDIKAAILVHLAKIYENRSMVVNFSLADYNKFKTIKV